MSSITKTMRKALKQMILLLTGAGLGLGLLYISSLFSVNKPGLITFWGFPFFWHVTSGTGFTGIDSCGGEGIPIFGGCLIGVFYARFVLDVAFWLALSLALVEVTDRVAMPYIRWKMKVHALKRRTIRLFRHHADPL